MSPYFLFNTLHFSLEITTALVFFVAAWLAFDALAVRRDFLTVSRGVGFLLLAFSQIVYGLKFAGGEYEYIGAVMYISGLVFVTLNLFLEHPVDRPSLKGLKGVVVGPLAIVTTYTNHIVAVLYLAIAALSYLQYRKESKKILKPFIAAFFFFFIAAILAIFYGRDELTPLWIAGNVFQAIGALSLLMWIWQYLISRVRDEIMVIFVSMALLVSVAVSLAFSIILVGQIDHSTEASLVTNVRVLDFSIQQHEAEAFAKVKLFASASGTPQAFSDNDLGTLEERASALLNDEKLGFVTFVDKDGFVLIRAHQLSSRSDNAAKEQAVGSALQGVPIATIETSDFEKLSIRAAAPVVYRGQVVGAIVIGYQLDTAFADNLKRLTGLDVTLFDKNIVSGSTILTEDQRGRIEGLAVTDPEVTSRVLVRGEPLTIRTDIAAQPFLASYAPLRDTKGAVVGMISAARSQQEILAIVSSTNLLTLLTVAVIMLLLMIPMYVITKRLSKDI